ncbi:MAG: hypothetical protein LBF13_00660 [Campylobacteraceae bacterium]|jgi:hypothetical protein|nr:hypothetical protein [Campylobacteraceae bacterium]
MNRFLNLQKIDSLKNSVKSMLEIVKKTRRIGLQNKNVDFACKDYCKIVLRALKMTFGLFKTHLILPKNIYGVKSTLKMLDTQTQKNSQKLLYTQLKNKSDFTHMRKVCPFSPINNIKLINTLNTFDDAKMRYGNILKNDAIYTGKEFIKASLADSTFWLFNLTTDKK